MPSALHNPTDAPNISDEQSVERERECWAKEQMWFNIQLSKRLLVGLKDGLAECLQLTNDNDTTTTLVMSSSHSEAVKGIVCRQGCTISKVDVALHLESSHLERLALNPNTTQSIHLTQLTNCRNSLQICQEKLQQIDGQDLATVCLFLKEVWHQLKYAHQCLNKPSLVFPNHALTPKLFEPVLSDNLAVDINLAGSNVVLSLYVISYPGGAMVSGTTGESNSGSGGGGGATSVLSGLFSRSNNKHQQQQQQSQSTGGRDIGVRFIYNGRRAIVQQSVAVESTDPGLMALTSKLGVLQANVGQLVYQAELILRG